MRNKVQDLMAQPDLRGERIIKGMVPLGRKDYWRGVCDYFLRGDVFNASGFVKIPILIRAREELNEERSTHKV